MGSVELGLRELLAFIADAPDAIIGVDATGLVRHFNPAAEKLFLRDADEACGQSLSHLIADGATSNSEFSVKSLLYPGGVPANGTWQTIKCVRSDGSEFDASFWTSAQDVAGSPAYLITLRDISERLRVRDVLERTREELQLTVEHAPIGIVAIDTAGRIRSLNQAALRMSGFDRLELLGQKALMFLHTDDHVVVRRSFRAIASNRRSHGVSTHSLRSASGEYLPIQLYTAIANDATGRARLLICMFEDITKQRDAESELQIQRERLAHVARLNTMGEMSLGIAHELNQPLSAIATYAQAATRLLADKAVSASESADVLEKIEAQAQRGAKIIEKLREQTRRHEPSRERVSLNELVTDLHPLIDIDSRHTGVRILADLEPVPACDIDRTQIEQVILNLVRNAIDAVSDQTDARKQVLVSTRVLNEGQVELSVADSGKGVPEQFRPVLFEPFFTTKKEGMGMGLSISRTLIDAHQGEIGYRDNTDGGAIFWFSLPVSANDE